ncbi:hypothetical protein C4K26_4217 [Pseudomonas chlororaphis]|uniref:hypothetical protein n=1 Tax=Pseudomonas chlororaphis TaxID=587753 RepID=UPI000F574410|nr:hypothetical protein [Pseudomonas chlororaphis]AZD09606.1 hypothetical protein C4K26_4217 [Pseudomonas chlororaphis]
MQESIERFFEIHTQLEQSEKKRRREKRREEKSTNAYRWGNRIFWWALCAPAILSIVVGGVAWIGDWREMFIYSWILLGISYLTVLVSPLLGSWLYRSALRRVYQAPFSNLLSINVKIPMQIDGRYLDVFCELPVATLQLGALELKSERASFEKRTTMFAGAIEKIGILPGLLAFMTTLPKLDAQPEWVYALAYATIVVMPLYVFVQMLLVRYDRMIALTELAIERKKYLSAQV